MSATVVSVVSRYCLRDLRSLVVMPDTICESSWRTGTMSSSWVVSWELDDGAPEESMEVKSMPLLMICSGYSDRVERSMSSM